MTIEAFDEWDEGNPIPLRVFVWTCDDCGETFRSSVGAAVLRSEEAHTCPNV